MAAVWVAIQVFLFTVVAPLVTHLLKALGIGLVTYVGIDLIFDQAEAQILSHFDGLIPDVYDILVLAGVRDGIQILFASAGAFVSIKTTTGAFSKWKTKPEAILEA